MDISTCRHMNAPTLHYTVLCPSPILPWLYVLVQDHSTGVVALNIAT